MPHLELPGVRLWYEDSGPAGTPVVFLHAFSGTTESWMHQVPAFAAAGFRCITYDRREWGRSTPAEASSPAGVDASDLHGLITALGLERVHLVGTAAGVVTACDYALLHPERVRALVAANSSGGMSDEAFERMSRNLRPPEIQALPVHLRELSSGYRGTDPEGARRWVEIEHASRPQGMPWAGRAPSQPMTMERLAGLAVPVLMIAGGADLITPPALMRLMAARIPDCTFEVLPEAGHAGHWEQPEVWNRLVLGFLQQH